MANFHGVKIPAQLTLAVLNQIRALTLERIAEYPDENAHLCRTVSKVFDLHNSEKNHDYWWIAFLCDVGIGDNAAFVFWGRPAPCWWPTRAFKSWNPILRNRRRLVFIDMLIKEVQKDA